ncbi:HEAT repeat domain-containing protein [Streptomyces sp. NPDC006879]|uniref:HEAT repeat domain-containing protein n=1 Tax=Streptomyces sp. NPDC006879 TaxID=3364767 RepID=UPI0036AF3031
MWTLIPLSPTRYLTPEERLLLGKPLARAIDTTDPEAWVHLEGRIRLSTWWNGRDETVDWANAPRWDEEAADVAWSQLPPSEPELALALCHDRGRVRETALTFAADRPEVIPLVLIRCADGQPRVREPARALLRTALTHGTLQATDLVSLAVRLALRRHGSWALEQVLAVAGPLPDTLLHHLCGSPLPHARLLGVRHSLERGLLTPRRLTELATTGKDPAVRHLCTEALLAAVTPGDPDGLLDPLLAASSAVARSSAVTALHRAGRGAKAQVHLSDPSARVRSAARLVMRLEGEDPLPHYRSMCADPASPGLPPGAVLGLAESAGPKALELLRPLTGHPEGRVRAAALAALRMTDAAPPDELMAAMTDPHPAVVRAARKALVPYVLLVPEAWLAGLVARSQPRHVRRAGLRLLCAHGLGLRRRVLAALEDDEDPEVAYEAQRARYEQPPPGGPTG